MNSSQSLNLLNPLDAPLDSIAQLRRADLSLAENENEALLLLAYGLGADFIQPLPNYNAFVDIAREVGVQGFFYENGADAKLAPDGITLFVITGSSEFSERKPEDWKLMKEILVSVAESWDKHTAGRRKLAVLIDENEVGKSSHD